MSGKTVAVVGGGPAGSFAAYLLAKEGINVNIYEPRAARQQDLSIGEKGALCTGCAGLVQKNAVILLRRHGISIPENVVQTRLNGSVIYLPGKSGSIFLPMDEAVTVYRGFSPLKQESGPIESFDAELLRRAKEAGAIHHQVEIRRIDLKRKEGKVHLTDASGTYHEADMIIGAFGHNPKLMEAINYPFPETTPLALPKTQRASVREYHFGQEKVRALLGDRIHIFGNPSETIWFSAIIPKGKYITIVLMGRNDDIKTGDFTDFLNNPKVQTLLDGNMGERPVNCACFNLITLKSPKKFVTCGDDGKIVMVNIGDAGPTTPRKNGIFAGLDSAQHLIATLLEYGNNADGMEKYQRYITKRYVWDNRWSEAVLRISDLILNHYLPRQATIYLAKNNIVFFSSAVKSVISHISTGRDSYWKIPLNVLMETVRNPKG